MQENTAKTKVTACCPAGHRIRGDVSFVGQTVRCPKCQTQFVFAAKREVVSDTEVMRMMGEIPRPATVTEPAPDKKDSSAVTDTGVMRILGDSPQLPPVPERKVKHEPTVKPCPRCGLAISAHASVCEHCNCYVGVMPRFLKDMTPGDSGSLSN